MGPSNLWWIIGAIFIIIGIVFIILHFQKEKVSGNTTIQKVFLYGGIILLVIGVILVAFWVIKKLTSGKKKSSMPSLAIDINQGYPQQSYYPQQGYPQQGYPQQGYY
jgi:amino acid transporter